MIAVYHPIFGTGGGEVVCMNVLEALQTDHDLKLYTLSDIDIDFLNEYFNTTVHSSISVSSGGIRGKVLEKSYSFCNSVSKSGLGRLHNSVFGRLLRPKLADYELVISTFGEFNFDTPSVQYIHYPMFNRGSIPDSVESRAGPRQVYDEVCQLLSGHQRCSPDSSILLANSKWTANLTEQVHDVAVSTLYPPVDTAGFCPKQWEQRKDGFVAISRIDPSKRIEDLIEIVERLQGRGHKVPLHIVGPTANSKYYKKIQTRAAENELIFLEGEVSREQLIEYVCSYKYGLHGMQYEHFGIVVAEFVAGGAIPFVHDSGGQREIVGGEERLRYSSISDAVNKIDRVLSDPNEQNRLQGTLPTVEKQFGKERFQREIRQVVDGALER